MNKYEYVLLDGTTDIIEADGWKKEYNEYMTLEYVFYLNNKISYHIPVWMVEDIKRIVEKDSGE